MQISSNTCLSRGAIDVWTAEVDRPQAEIQHYADLLSGDEAALSSSFHAVRDRKRYVVRHGMLRVLLSVYLGGAPDELEIRFDSKGKPYVSDPEDKGALQFSISHSAGLAVFAFRRGGSVGVDVERISGFPDMRDVAVSNFTSNEIQEIDDASEEDRVETFFKLWTRKEAVLKANGMGLLLPLGSVDVSAQSGHGRTRGVRIKGDIPGREYRLIDFTPAPGFAAAAAVDTSHDVALMCRHYRPPSGLCPERYGAGLAHRITERRI